MVRFPFHICENQLLEGPQRTAGNQHTALSYQLFYASLSYRAPNYCRCSSGKFISQSLNLLLPGVFPTPSSHQRKTISQDIQTPTPAFMLGLLQSPLFPVNHDYKPSPTFSPVSITHLQGQGTSSKAKFTPEGPSRSVCWRKRSLYQNHP